MESGPRGTAMPKRLSVNALLSAAIALLALFAVAMLAARAWDSWQRLAVTSRITTIAEASGYAFTAMHNLRVDRASTVRTLNGASVIEPGVATYIRKSRDAELPALEMAIALANTTDFPNQQELVATLRDAAKAFAAMQAESWEAFSKPKAERREGLAKQYTAAATTLIDTLDKMSASMFASVRYNDAVIDQLLGLKQVAWIVRNEGGEASVIVSNGIVAGQVSPDAQAKYAQHVGGTNAAWATLEALAFGSPLPPRLVQAMTSVWAPATPPFWSRNGCGALAARRWRDGRMSGLFFSGTCM